MGRGASQATGRVGRAVLRPTAESTQGSGIHSKDRSFPIGDFFFYPRGHWAMSGDIFRCHTGGLLASNGLRPGIPLNALQCTGQTPPKKDYPTQNVNSAEVGKPRSRPMRAFRASESPSVKWEEDRVITTWADFHRVRAFQAPKPTVCSEGAMNNGGPPGRSVLP